MHMSKSAASQLTLRTRVLNLLMKPEQTVRAYVNSIYEIENELALTGMELSDDDKRFALLEGLREEYVILKTILQHETELSFEEMVSRLEAREEEFDREKDDTTDEALEKSSASLFTQYGKEGRHRRHEQQSKQDDRNHTRRGKCHICVKTGHFARDCYFNPKSSCFRAFKKECPGAA